MLLGKGEIEEKLLFGWVMDSLDLDRKEKERGEGIVGLWSWVLRERN